MGVVVQVCAVSEPFGLHRLVGRFGLKDDFVSDLVGVGVGQTNLESRGLLVDFLDAGQFFQHGPVVLDTIFEGDFVVLARVGVAQNLPNVTVHPLIFLV